MGRELYNVKRVVYDMETSGLLDRIASYSSPYYILVKFRLLPLVDVRTGGICSREILKEAKEIYKLIKQTYFKRNSKQYKDFGDLKSGMHEFRQGMEYLINKE